MTGCGLLTWTVEKWGRPTHKHDCEDRRDEFCQLHPDGCPVEFQMKTGDVVRYLGWRAIVLHAGDRRVKIEDPESSFDGFEAAAAPEHLEAY